jgi:glucokinase
MNFAPQTDVEWQIAQRLMARFGHVSNERILSGPGLVNIYESLCEIGGRTPAAPSPADIVARGLGGADTTARETLDLFCAALGSAAGDLALLFYADAVFIAGGIVPRFVDFLRASRFRARFEAKGRYAAYLARVPTQVITEKYAGLIGAAVHLLQRQAA